MTESEQAVDLHITIDAKVWAEEFHKLYPILKFPEDQEIDSLEIIHGWIANAMFTQSRMEERWRNEQKEQESGKV